MFFVADVLFLFFLFVYFFKKLLHVYMCLPKTPEVEWFIFLRKIIVFMGLYSETVRETSCFLHLLSNICFLHHSLLVLSSLFQCLRFRICVLQSEFLENTYLKHVAF